MSSPVQSPVSGGRPLLRGRVLGFPVHLDISFLLIMGVLGYASGLGLRDWVIWLLITPVAVLLHELGHALTARAAGASPEIALAGFGGVTTYVPPRPLSRARSLGISLAGPAVGLAVGAVLIAVAHVLSGDIDRYGWVASALSTGIWTSVGWSVFNLLPVVPLDGGQAIREILPGAPAVRARRAAVVSLVTAVVVALVAWFWLHQTFIALFMGFFALNAVLELRNGDPRRREVVVTPEQAVVHLLWQGDPGRAREVLASLEPGTQVDLAVHGAVLALTGDAADKAQGHALLDQEMLRRPDNSRVAALLVLTLALEHDWDALIALLTGPAGPLVPGSAVDRAVHEARGVGREDVAGRLTQLALTRSQPPGESPGDSAAD